MLTSSTKLPLAYYKLLLVQIMMRILSRLCDCGIERTSKRHKIIAEIVPLCRQLEREFKRDVTLEQARQEKRVLVDELYGIGGVPEWLIEVLFNSLTEESRKLSK